VQRHLTPDRGVGKKKLKYLTAEALDDLYLRTCELTLIEVGVAVRAGLSRPSWGEDARLLLVQPYTVRARFNEEACEAWIEELPHR
jgi:hypothetical protein